MMKDIVLPGREQEPQILQSLTNIQPLRVIERGVLSSVTANIYTCESPLVKARLILKLARDKAKEPALRQETADIRQLRTVGVPYIIPVFAAGKIPEKGDLFGILEKRADGLPISIKRTALPYCVPTAIKVHALTQYLEFLVLAYEKAGYAKTDLQAEGIFWKWDADKKYRDINIEVVDFTPHSSNAKPNDVLDILRRFTIPQIPGLFEEVFGCGPVGSDIGLYAVSPDELMPTPVLYFYNQLKELPVREIESNTLGRLFEQFRDIGHTLIDGDYATPESNRIDLRHLAQVDGYQLFDITKSQS